MVDDEDNQHSSLSIFRRVVTVFILSRYFHRTSRSRIKCFGCNHSRGNREFNITSIECVFFALNCYSLNNQNTMHSRTILCLGIAVCLMLLVQSAESKKKQTKKADRTTTTETLLTPASPLKDIESKQFFSDPQSRETDPPNFVRLVVMRLIYGFAVQMGLEDRLSGVLNGIFVPPNAEDDYGGGFGDDLLDF